jgi:hypothetical protein
VSDTESEDAMIDWSERGEVEFSPHKLRGPDRPTGLLHEGWLRRETYQRLYAAGYRFESAVSYPDGDVVYVCGLVSGNGSVFPTLKWSGVL